MNGEKIRSTEACQLIRQLEQLLETRILTLVLEDRPDAVAFLLPADASPEYLADLLGRVGEGCWYALERL